MRPSPLVLWAKQVGVGEVDRTPEMPFRPTLNLPQTLDHAKGSVNLGTME